MFNLQGKKAFITGGASGIGRAVAEEFINQGATVVIADIVDPTTVAEEIGAQAVYCNVAEEGSVADALMTACELLGGPLDIVVLNAGVGEVGPSIEETEQALLEKTTRVNQWGVFYGLKHAPAHLNDGGSIISTSSMAAFINMPGTAVYSASKRAMCSMTEMAALELGSRGIRVHTVCPGYVNTALGDTQEEQRVVQTFTALQRCAEPREDIAGVFVFLASDASRYMTGQSLKVDGGWHCGPTVKLLELVTGNTAAPGSTPRKDS
jgi:NAD(P)-dependent dehydrogenase (short-subunit alcohol dehydrogenase family)